MNREQEIAQMIFALCQEPEVLECPDLDLLERQLLDSLDFAQLFEEIEDRYGVEIYPTQYRTDAFATPARISRLVETLLAEGKEPPKSR